MARKPLSQKFEEVSGAPEGVPWCWLSRDLLKAQVWIRRSIHCVRLIDFLLLENMTHAGRENGNLAAPWDQLVRHGISRRYIAAAIKEAEAFRLIEVRRGAKKAHNKAAMSRYRLTFLASIGETDEEGKPLYWVKPTDEWRKVKADAVLKFLA